MTRPARRCAVAAAEDRAVEHQAEQRAEDEDVDEGRDTNRPMPDANGLPHQVRGEHGDRAEREVEDAGGPVSDEETEPRQRGNRTDPDTRQRQVDGEQRSACRLADDAERARFETALRDGMGVDRGGLVLPGDEHATRAVVPRGVRQRDETLVGRYGGRRIGDRFGEQLVQRAHQPLGALAL